MLLEEDGGIVAAYLEAVHARAIPAQYAALIQYADCMIDTTAQIYLTDGNSRTDMRNQIQSKWAAATKAAGLKMRDVFLGVRAMGHTIAELWSGDEVRIPGLGRNINFKHRATLTLHPVLIYLRIQG